MSETSCSACNDIREYAPEFALNGVTETVGAHLMDNEGLSGAEGHEDCEDSSIGITFEKIREIFLKFSDKNCISVTEG